MKYMCKFKLRFFEIPEICFFFTGSTGAYVPKSLFEIDTIRFLTMYILYGMLDVNIFIKKLGQKLISFNFLVLS
jgi:hypothetical protein